MAGDKPIDISGDADSGLAEIPTVTETGSTAVSNACADSASDPSETQTGPKDKGGRPRGAKTDPEKLDLKRTAQIIDLAVKGVNNQMIARAVNMPESTVRHKLKVFEPVFAELKNVDEYRTVKARLLSATEIRLLKKIVSGKALNKANLSSLAYAFNAINNANRLEQGKATSHVAVHHTEVDLSDYTPTQSEEDADLDPA